MNAATPLSRLLPTRAPGDRLGPYLLQQALADDGQGARWRALEEAQQREVLIRLLPLAEPAVQSPDGVALPAAAGMGLQHPHLQVLLAQWPLPGLRCLVYEWAGGCSLGQWLAEHGTPSVRESVRWVAELASALQALHGAGWAHGAVDATSVCIDPLGRLRLSGLGMGLATAGPDGCPPASPHQDLQAALALLATLLVGRPLRAGENLFSVLQAGSGDRPNLGLAPGSTNGLEADRKDPDERGDAALRVLLLQAAAAGPQAGFADAGSLCAALLAWLLPKGLGADSTSAGEGTLGLLLQRMQHRSDFPALSGRVRRIQRLAGSESAPLQLLTDEILQDVALTQKLLRLVNTVHFRREADGVATVSRAVALVGLAGIRNLSLSLVLVDHLSDRAHAQRLKQAFLRALLAGQLAQALAASVQEAEEAYLGALFHNLGSLLAECYLPEAAAAVRQQVTQRLAEGGVQAWSAERLALLQEQAAGEVLGLGFGTLGMAVARHWDLPETLQQCMPCRAGAAPGRLLPAGPERLRWLALASNDTALALWTFTEGNEAALTSALDAVVRRHGRALGLNLDMLRQAARVAWLAVSDLAPAMGLTLPGASVGSSAPRAAALTAGAPASTLKPQPAPPPPPAAAAVPDTEAAVTLLSAGMLKVADALASEQVRLNQVLHLVLETLFHGLKCRRVVLCLRDADGRRLVGRFGLGDGVMASAAQLQVLLKPASGQRPDLVAEACALGRDEWLEDLAMPAVAERLPDWLSQGAMPGSCIVLPLHLRGAPLAMVYADHAQARPVSERERALLRALRNQALVAFKLVN